MVKCIIFPRIGLGQDMQFQLYTCIAVTLMLVTLGSPLTFAQIERPTFQETAQVIVDGLYTSTKTVSIVLQSTDTNEIKIPPELEQRIRDDLVTAVIITNHNNCILGVIDQSCILVNVQRDLSDDLDDIQSSSADIGSRFIDDINSLFQTNAKFHSVFIHSDDTSNQALNTSGIVSGKGTISVVYTMPREDTSTMYQNMADLLLSDEISNAGGLYDITSTLSTRPNTTVTFSMIPSETNSLMQIKLSTDSPINMSDITIIDPLDLFKVGKITKSRYLDTGFYQINSLVHVVILSPTDMYITDVQGDEIPTQMINGQKIPSDFEKQGWIFDPESGTRIDAKYLFGEMGTIKQKDLIFSISNSPNTFDNATLTAELNTGQDPSSNTLEQYVIVGMIVVIGVAAALYYLKGYRR